MKISRARADGPMREKPAASQRICRSSSSLLNATPAFMAQTQYTPSEAVPRRPRRLLQMDLMPSALTAAHGDGAEARTAAKGT